MTQVAPAELAAALALILRKGGCDDEVAAEVAAALVDADLAGHGTHGARQIEFYVERLRRGEVDGRMRPAIAHDGGAVVRVAGRRAFGQVAGAYAARVGTERALRSGVCLVCIHGSGHFGRNGQWPEIAAAAGVGSLHFGQGLTGPGPVVPFGGREGRLNTNPIAFGLPGSDDDDALILDCATSAVSGSRLKQMVDRGEWLDDAILLRKDGTGSRDPAEFMRGDAAMTTFGGFKGYAISVFAEILSSIIATGGSAHPATNSLFSVYFDIARLIPRDRYRAALSAWRTRLTGAVPEGSPGGIAMPGDRARSARRGAGARGLELTADVAAHVRRAADMLSVWSDALTLCPSLAIAGDHPAVGPIPPDHGDRATQGEGHADHRA